MTDDGVLTRHCCPRHDTSVWRVSGPGPAHARRAARAPSGGGHDARRPPLRRPADRPQPGGAGRRAALGDGAAGRPGRARPADALCRPTGSTREILAAPAAAAAVRSSRSCATTSGTRWSPTRARRSTRCWPATSRRVGDRLRSAGRPAAAVPDGWTRPAASLRRDAAGARRDGDRPVHRDAARCSRPSSSARWRRSRRCAREVEPARDRGDRGARRARRLAASPSSTTGRRRPAARRRSSSPASSRSPWTPRATPTRCSPAPRPT